MGDAVLVTGASSGLGLATSTSLAKAGRPVILGCRNAERGAAAASSIRAQAPDADVSVLELDVANLSSVRAAVRALDGRPLGALVCNAGIQLTTGVQRSPDGHELTFATNHLGHFLLIQSLLEHLGEPARIVLVSSGTHLGPLQSFGFPAPRWEDPRALADPGLSSLGGSARHGRIRYSTSKLANIYTTYELARRLRDRKITANAFDPGLMPETGLARDYPPPVRRLYARIAPMLIRALPGVRPVDQSASDLAWLVTSPEPAAVSGAYFTGRTRRRSSAESYDEARAKELWEVSEELIS
ncbi:SDR family NAD(P)-dependent oxidoreductase [Saccharopolyspora sp. NPDC050389]|uniref:SDR family NAD(P)-dependent oxidoreductase n=1 Tax=Saccharopolyspora sp. NPDC050389 TaxID=3155516 RepID=UPI0033F86789